MGNYMLDNFKLPDRRNDVELKKLWDEDYKTYLHVIDTMNKRLK